MVTSAASSQFEVPISFDKRHTLSSRYSAIAALPMSICLMLPLVQVGGLVYLYDLFLFFSIVMLGFPRAISKSDNIIFFLRVLVLGVVFALLSGLFRTGIEIKTVQYAVQFVAALLYCESVYRNVLAQRVDPQKVASWMVVSSFVLGIVSVLHYLSMQIDRELGVRLYVLYLEFAGRTTSFFEGKYLAAIVNTGVIRAMGTWDVATTFGGMMVLSLAWLKLYQGKAWFKYLVFVTGSVAILASSSRHSWVIALFVMFAILPGRFSKKMLAVSVIGAILLAIVVVQDGSDSLARNSAMTLEEQIVSRIERTELSDTSLVARYYDGTLRFFRYSLDNPLVLFTGFGMGMEKTLSDKFGPAAFRSMQLQNDMYGFVSNSWLLIWRNLGIFGFLGLVGLWVTTYRRNPNLGFYPVVVCGLVVLADNYFAQVARCFFLVLSFVVIHAGWIARINLSRSVGVRTSV